MNELKANLKRLSRLVRIRQTYTSAAEAGVKRAESEVRRLEAAESEAAGNIANAQAEVAYLRTTTGQEIHRNESYIRALEWQRHLIRQSLETATSKLAERRNEWTEARRDEKIAEKLHERRFHQWQHENDVAQQKLQDDASIARYIRTRSE